MTDRVKVSLDMFMFQTNIINKTSGEGILHFVQDDLLINHITSSTISIVPRLTLFERLI